MLYQCLKPLLFLMDPESAHHVALSSLKIAQYVGLLPAQKVNHHHAVQCFGLTFPNPIGLAAGLDKDAQCLNAWSRMGFGFVEVGTVTPKPQIGNPRPRLFRLKADRAIINRMGFNNQGVAQLIERVKAQPLSIPVGINIGKNKDTPIEKAYEDYLYCFEQVYPFADYVTVNISSPNTPDLKSLQHGDLLKSILMPLKQKQVMLQQQHQKQVPILVKISPDLTIEECKQIVSQCLEYQIEGMIATNTTVTRPPALKSSLQSEQGGLSGEPLKVMSDRMIAQIHHQAGDALPIIAVGGIMTPEDVLTKLKLGAKLVQLYSGLIYQGPRLIQQSLRMLPTS